MSRALSFQQFKLLSSLFLVAAIVGLGGFAPPGHASRGCINYPDYQHSIGNVLLPGTSQDAVLKGDFLYIAADLEGISVVDVSQPSSPVQVVNYPVSNALDVDLAGDYLFVSHSDGLLVLDISNPTSPQFVSTLLMDGDGASGVKVDGTTALVGLRDGTMHVVDIANPAYPMIVGSINVGNEIHDIEIDNKVAYLAATWSGLQIVDFSNQSAPVWLAEFPSSTGIFSVELQGPMALITERLNGMYLLDISTPANPQELGFAAIPSALFLLGITVVDQYAYVVNGGPGSLSTIDISDPSNPVLVAQAITSGNSSGILVNDGIGFVLNGYDGLNVMDVSNHLVAPVIGAVDLPGLSQKVYVQDNLALIAAHHDGLQIVDIADPSAPQLVGELAQPGETANVVARGNRAYLANSTNGLQIVDISTPSEPALMGAAYLEGTVKDIALVGDIAYVTDNWGVFYVVDISDANAPVVIGSLDTPGPAYALEIDGNLAYVTAGSAGLLAIDISTPENPVLVGQLDMPSNAGSLELIPGYALVGAEYDGLVVIDISSVSHMFEATVMALPGSVGSVKYDSGIVYAADYSNGLNIIDFGDPLNPVAIEYRPAEGYTRGLFVTEEFVAMAMSFAGLEIIPQHCSAISSVDDDAGIRTVSSLRIRGNYPNPFNPRTEILFSVPQAGIGSLKIYTVRGEMVRSLFSGQFEQGAGSLVWDGRADDGQQAGSGVYFYRLVVGTHSAASRMVLLK